MKTSAKLRPAPATRSTARRPRLGVEQLDRRDLPAGISLSAGLLTIEGYSSADSASVSLVSGQVKASLYSYAEGLGLWLGLSKYYATGSVTDILFLGHEGDDTFANNTAITSTAYGHEGDDELQGGINVNVLDGGADNDHLVGSWLGDSLYGGGGNDVLDAGSGADYLSG